MNQKGLKTLGWIATCTAMLMYISYFPQIMNNLHGMKSGFLQPMVAAINCSLWVTYGFMQEKKDWPLMMANLPGVFIRRNRRNYSTIRSVPKGTFFM